MLRYIFIGNFFISEIASPRVTLTGHENAVTCVVVSAEIGLVISGSRGQYQHF